MIFGKHINVYYRKYALALLTGLLALFTVDYLQLKIPEIYQLVINGLNQGYILENGVQIPFDMDFMLDRQHNKEAPLLERFSFNFTLALYDTDTDRLYVCELDT